MKKVFDAVFVELGSQALQYGPTEGYTPLREFIADKMNTAGINNKLHNVIITAGSQQSLDLAGKVFLDELSLKTQHT